MKTWKIAYTIQHGEYEYGDYFTCELPADSLDHAAAAALIADQWGLTAEDDPDARQQFLQELQAEGYAFLPDESRCITDLGWEPVSPIIVTVRNGFVEAVTGVPEGVRLEVRDWNNGELGEDGEPVPTVSEWPGPC